MSQLNLNLATRLPYSPVNYVIHSGVASVLYDAFSLLKKDQFSICFFEAQARSGKTHFSIKLADLLSQDGFFPRIVEGQIFRQWVEDHLRLNAFDQEEVVIVDDAELYFNSLKPGSSGPFVALIESLRQKKSGIVFLSSVDYEHFECDEHVTSRLVPGVGYSIEGPAEKDLPELIEVMSKQRGMVLSSRKIDYLTKRIGHDLPSIEKYLDRLNHLSQVLGKPVRFKVVSDAL